MHAKLGWPCTFAKIWILHGILKPTKQKWTNISISFTINILIYCLIILPKNTFLYKTGLKIQNNNIMLIISWHLLNLTLLNSCDSNAKYNLIILSQHKLFLQTESCVGLVFKKNPDIVDYDAHSLLFSDCFSCL